MFISRELMLVFGIRSSYGICFTLGCPDMLLLLIPIAWLAVVVLFVALCAAAARGDRIFAGELTPEQRLARGGFQHPAATPTLRGAGA
jgi:hypothetical protein